jgi:hypothetical protein
MSQDRMMQAIGRIERALARLEKIDVAHPPATPESGDLQRRYEKLRAETQAAIGAMDSLLNGGKA